MEKHRTMNPEKITKEFYTQLEDRGCKGKIVSIDHLGELQAGIYEPHKQGLFDEGFYQEWLEQFSFMIPAHLPDSKSIIIVAVPQPQVQVSFTVQQQILKLIIPPTYSHATDEQAKRTLEDLLEPGGYRLIKANLPLKLLAVHSGLAKYGKNNVTYIGGMGSYYRLVAFYSDLPCTEDNWRDLQVMDECERCSACARACPTGAIASERFLLRAERCLTNHNESPGTRAFPAWIDPAWHNCAIGCMRCQEICPVNRHLPAWIEDGAEFSHEESTLLLGRKSNEEIPAETVRKLAQISLHRDIEKLPRNSGVFLEKLSSH
jgi:epoxyqueuosine reductase